jgi:hypothetical protein
MPRSETALTRYTAVMPDAWIPPDNIPASILGMALKLNRAQFHLNTLKESIDAFFESKPYEIVREANPNTNEIYGTLRVKRECPPAWGILVGDFVHNLRSALDYLVWQLVIHETGNPPVTFDTQFPIFQTEAGYKSRGEPVRLKGVGAKAKALIKTLQPFSTGEGTNSPLWHLHELANFDKHRRICLASAVTHALHVQGVAGEVTGLIVGKQGELQDGAILVGVRLVPSNTPILERAANVKMDGGFTYYITLQEPSLTQNDEQIVKFLSVIGTRVFEIVERIRIDILEI